MKTDFELWLSAQFADTGPFTMFIVLLRIAGEEIGPLKSSYAHLIGDDVTWSEIRGLLDGARASRDGVAFFVGLGHAGGLLPDEAAARKLKEVEADVATDALTHNRGLFLDREGRQLRVDEVGG